MIAEILIAILSALILYIAAIYVQHIWNLPKYPKGPFPLPVIGNLHLLSQKPHQILKNMTKKYGDVFSISFGMERVTIINTIEAAREAMVTRGSDFAGRPTDMYTINLISKNGSDILFADYDSKYTFMRKVAHRGLRMFSESIGRLVAEECTVLDKCLKENEGKQIDLSHDLACSVTNIICHIVFGKRYGSNDTEFHSIVEFCDLMTQGFASGPPVAFLPWLRFFPLSSVKKLKKFISIRDPIIHKQVVTHKKSFNPKELRDLTDFLLNLDEKQWNDAGFKEVTDDQIEMIVQDIFVGGFETTITTLRWACVYLLHHPQYQQEIYQEIRHVVGNVDDLKLSHKKDLNIVQATVYETLRLSTLPPLGIPHKAITDSTIAGVKVPEGAQVWLNMWAIHFDERHWDNPNVFNPRRWLDTDGKFDPKKNVSYLPFSIGKRACLGEDMAKKELFLFFARIFGKFEILPIPNEPLPSIEGHVALIQSPFPFKVIIKSRK